MRWLAPSRVQRPLAAAAALAAALLAGCAGAPESADGEPTASGFDWGVIAHQRGPQRGSGTLLPLYSYSYDDDSDERSVTVWPLLTGYRSTASGFTWFSLPLLTLVGESAGPNGVRSEFFSSLPLLTFANSDVGPRGESHDQIVLPLLMMTRERIYKGERGTLTRQTTYNPILTRERMVRRTRDGEGEEQRLEISRRQIVALPLGGEDRISLADLRRWDEDVSFGLLNIFNVSLVGFQRYRGRYAGSRWLTSASGDPRVRRPGFGDGGEAASLPRKTQLNLLGPLIEVRSGGPETGWDVLSLLSYQRSDEHWSLALTPLMLELRDGSPRFNPATWERMWPILRRDRPRRRWDILWPLAHVRDDEFEDRTEVSLRFLFRYYQKSDYRETRLLDGILYDHVEDDRVSATNLAMGFLFSRQTRESDGFRGWQLCRGILLGRSEKDGHHPTWTVLLVSFGGGKKTPKLTSAE